MPSGERSQTWYPEVVALLRSRWRTDLAWEDIITLRDHLQSAMEELRARRGIVAATVRCPSCGITAPGAEPRISIRALLISVRRFGIDADDVIRARERDWARRQQKLQLDLFGRPHTSPAPYAGSRSAAAQAVPDGGKKQHDHSAARKVP